MVDNDTSTSRIERSCSCSSSRYMAGLASSNE
jgi:hypothetical protein